MQPSEFSDISKDLQTVRFLLRVGVEVNTMDEKGMTALDIVIRSKREYKDSEIKNSLKHGGCKVNKKKWERSLKRDENSLEKKKSALMVVAVLIATMAFQIGTNPPGGLWQGDEGDREAGSSLFANKYTVTYERFYILNTVAFITSLTIILLLMSGLPLRRRLFMWILMLLTWIAITSIALSYIYAIVVLTPKDKLNNPVMHVVYISLNVWVGLMALLLLVHMIRLIVKLVKKTRNLYVRRRNNNIIAGGVAV